MSSLGDKCSLAPVDTAVNAADSIVTSQSSAPTCTSCNNTITAKCLALKCSACGSLCHMTCFVNYYVATNG